MKIYKQSKKRFLKFVKAYDLHDDAIKRKYLHSLRVAHLCKKITSSLKFNKQEQALAFQIGLFHDVARFEQWKKYKTFIDEKSFDHGNEGKRIFDENFKDLIFPEKFLKIIEYSIFYHNKVNVRLELEKIIDDKTFFEEVLYYSDILQDADKLDILWQEGKGILNSNCRDSYLNPEVFYKFENKLFIKNNEIISCLDKKIQRLAFSDQLKFNYSNKKKKKSVELIKKQLEHLMRFSTK